MSVEEINQSDIEQKQVKHIPTLGEHATRMALHKPWDETLLEILPPELLAQTLSDEVIKKIDNLRFETTKRFQELTGTDDEAVFDQLVNQPETTESLPEEVQKTVKEIKFLQMLATTIN